MEQYKYRGPTRSDGGHTQGKQDPESAGPEVHDVTEDGFCAIASWTFLQHCETFFVAAALPHTRPILRYATLAN